MPCTCVDDLERFIASFRRPKSQAVESNHPPVHFEDGVPVATHRGRRNNPMKNSMLKLYVKLRMAKDAFVKDESGQDLIEYALVVSLIALGATAAMGTVATSISTAFNHMGSKITSSVP